MGASLLLIEHGANVNAKNKSGNTPLHDACRGVPGPRRARRTETIRLLLSHGAPGVKNAKGYTPLGYVTSLPDDHPAREEIIELFREHAPEVVMEAWCTQGTTDIS